IAKMAKDLGVGEPTLHDILEELKKPARDPREDAPPVVFRSDVTSFEDLKEGMEFSGTVRNVVDFGAFVDIGVKQDGLVHISKMSKKYINHPMDVVSIGDTVKVKILSVDHEKKKISLSMID
ncbi:MAG: S1 RNA-binding domain-containing protein, partial [Eubacterium sp.]|nr:S1 RNA-binding domain-containing protein [Eubacterium sp.]